MINVFLKITLIVLLFSLTACNTDNNSSHYKLYNDNLPHYVIKDEPRFKDAWHFAYDEKFARDYDINSDAHIDIEEAWRITRGAGVVVAIIDSGSFEVSHEDLKENIIDTHNTNYDNKNVSVKYDNPQIDGHGLAVAGFVASPANGKGLVGAAPEAKLVLIQIGGSDESILKAFIYAKNSGAKIINCSWGTENISPIIANYLQELKDDGITIVFASGNNGYDFDYRRGKDVSELPSVIGVGASNELNKQANYSNYGENIDILAPGGNINTSKGILALFENNSYAYTNGTSIAAPITAGIIALMLSVNSSLTPDQIREILIQSSDKISRYSIGKINATNAVKLAKEYL